MLKTIQLKSKWVVFILLFIGNIAYSQSFAALRIDDDYNQEETRSLKSVLKELEDSRGVFFVYESKMLENKQVGKTNKLMGDVEKILKSLLDPLGLKYKKVDNVYVILSEEGGANELKKIENKSGSVFMPGNSDYVAERNKDHLPDLQTRITKGVNWLQDKPITGKVTSGDDGSPIPGVNIVVKGTTAGTSTDANGDYQLSVPENATLVFSYVGFKNQEVAVGTRSVIDVQLTLDVEALTEVVVVGYGTQRKKDVTGATAQVSSKDFNAGINPSPLQAVQGKVSGLVITSASGDPNADPTVKLRGYTSLAGDNGPLYVVDNVIGVPVNTIAPSDIETVDVLKDASASAIYGSRAANGVIIITTKRGKEGKSSVSFNTYGAIETISSKFQMMNADEWREEVRRTGKEASLASLDKGANTDWLKEVTRLGYAQNHDLAFTGGGKSFSYRASINYLYRQGIINRSDFERITGRINVDQKALNDKLTIQYNISATSSVYDRSGQGGSNPQSGTVSQTRLFLPIAPVYDENNTQYGGYYEQEGSFNLVNPVAMSEGLTWLTPKKVLIAGMNLKYELIKGLFVGANGAYKYENELHGYKFKSDVKGYQGAFGEAGRWSNDLNNKLIELTLNYNKAIGENTFNLLGGYSYQEEKSEGFNANNRSFVTDEYSYYNLTQGQALISNPSSGNMGSYGVKWKLVSFFGRLTANFLNGKYNISATVRQDGSTKFGKNDKWGMFPALAASWNISDEDFFSNPIVNQLKLRAAWGRTGNSENISPYRSLRLISNRGTYYEPVIKDYYSGYDVTQDPNPNLKWEVVEQTNIGLDFGLWNGRINGTFEIYRKRTKDMLYNYDVAQGTVYGGQRITTGRLLANVGSMRNDGIELSLNANVINAGDFNWNTTITGSIYRNKIEELYNEELAGDGVIRYATFEGRGLSDEFVSFLEVGKPLGTFKVAKFKRFEDQGDKSVMVFETPEGVETLDKNEAMYYAGDALPRRTLAWTNTFTFKNFDLNFMLRGVFGNKIMNNAYANFVIPGSILESNMLRDSRNFPANYSTPQVSDLWLESGTFVRLDNMSLGYNIPAKGLLTSARIYLAAQNLFVITKYKGIDPEIEVKGSLEDSGTSQKPSAIGVDKNGAYPKTRAFQIGLNLAF